MEADADYDGQNPYCVRIRSNYKDGFFVIPYTELSDEKDDRTYVYRFEPTGTIPEPDMSYLRDRGEEILDK